MASLLGTALFGRCCDCDSTPEATGILFEVSGEFPQCTDEVIAQASADSALEKSLPPADDKNKNAQSEEARLALMRRLKFADPRLWLPKRFEVDALAQPLGRSYLVGGFGSVQLVRDKELGRTVAVKRLSKRRPSTAEQVRAIVAPAFKLRNSHICPPIDVVVFPQHVFITSEPAGGREVAEYLSEPPRGKGTSNLEPRGESAARLVLKQILVALEHAHGIGVAHGDLRPANVRICFSPEKEPAVCVVGWGLGGLLQDKSVRCGSGGGFASIALSPPEGWSGLVAHDLWCLGIIAHLLLVGVPPVATPAHPGTEESEEVALLWESVSDGAKDFVDQLLVAEEGKRMPVASALQHPWLNGRSYFSQLTEANQAGRITSELRKFADLQLLVTLCTAAIARKMDDVRIEDLFRFLLGFDRTRAGRLAPNALRVAFSKVLGPDSPEKEHLEDLLRSSDVDETRSVVAYMQLCALGYARRLDAEDDLMWSVFCHFDSAGSGELEAPAVQELVLSEELRAAFSAEACQKVGFMLEGLPGKISLQEFQGILRRVSAGQVPSGTQLNLAPANEKAVSGLVSATSMEEVCAALTHLAGTRVAL